MGVSAPSVWNSPRHIIALLVKISIVMIVKLRLICPRNEGTKHILTHYHFPHTALPFNTIFIHPVIPTHSPLEKNHIFALITTSQRTLSTHPITHHSITHSFTCCLLIKGTTCAPSWFLLNTPNQCALSTHLKNTSLYILSVHEQTSRALPLATYQHSLSTHHLTHSFSYCLLIKGTTFAPSCPS